MSYGKWFYIPSRHKDIVEIVASLGHLLLENLKKRLCSPTSVCFPFSLDRAEPHFVDHLTGSCGHPAEFWSTECMSER